MVTDFSAPHFWWRISSWRASMPRTPICAPVVHKTTKGQIIVSNLLLKPMLPAKFQIHANTIDNHNAGVSPLSSSTASLHNNLQPRICHLCCMLKTVPDWGKRDGLMSLSSSVLMAESETVTVTDVLTNPPGKCLWLAISVWQTSKLWRIEFCDGPNAPFNKRPVCGVPIFSSVRKSGNFLHILEWFPYWITPWTWRKKDKNPLEKN